MRDITPNHIDKKLKNYDLILIDNDIFEIDHTWYKLNFEDYFDIFNNIKDKVIIIKNTNNKILRIFMHFKNIDLFNTNIDYFNMLFDAKKLNPINSRKKYNLLVFSFHKKINDDILQRIINIDFSLISFNKFSRVNFKKLYKQIKCHRVIYIPYSKELDINVICIIERISIMLNTMIVVDIKFNKDFKYCIKCDLKEFKELYDVIYSNRIIYNKFLNDSRRELFIYESNISSKLYFNESTLTINKNNNPKISVIISTYRKNKIQNIISTLNKQVGVKIECIIITHGFYLSNESLDVCKNLADFDIYIYYESDQGTLGKCLNKGVQRASYNIICKMDDDDFYSENYLLDHYHSLVYSDSEIVGKGAHFMYLEDKNLIIQRETNKEFKYSNIVMGATIFGYREVFLSIHFKELNQSEDSDFLYRANIEGYKIYQNSPYGFCVYRNRNLFNHTWQASSLELMKHSEIISHSSLEESQYLIE